jgi:predicted permease
MAYSLARDAADARRAGVLAHVVFWVRTAVSLVGLGLLERVRSVGGFRSESSGRAMGVFGVGDLVLEARVALRRLVRAPGFSAASIVTLGFGIGATTAIFSVVYGVILRPLPYPEPDGLVVVGHESMTGELGMPAAGWFHYSDRSRTLSDIAIYIESSASITGQGQPLELGIIQASPTFLDVLGVAPAMGRGLSPADAEPGAPPVVLVSHGYWVRVLGSDPDVIGRPLLEGDDDIVVGVLPADFEFERPPATVVFGNGFGPPDVILPLRGLERAGAWFGNYMYQGVARLAPGVTAADAERELYGLMLEAAQAYPGGFTPAELEEGGYRPRVARFGDAIVGDLAGVLWIVFGAVGFVLVIATANVANLFLVRAESRRSELAVRRALGASGASLARTFLIESVLLAGAGGVLGVVLAATGTQALLGLTPSDLPRAEGVGISSGVLAFAAGLSVLTGVAFGVSPMFRRAGTSNVLGERSRGGTAGVRASRSRRVLVVTQVALAVVLLVGSGLLLRTFQNLRDVDPGFDGGRTATLRLALSNSLLRAAGRTEPAADAARSRFMLELADRLESVPGVERATFAADLPLDGMEAHDFIGIEGRLPSGLESASKALRVFIGPGYLDAIGARLVQGRELEEREFHDQPRSVVVNRTFAQLWFPDGDVIGSRLMQWAPAVDPTRDVWYTIVGIVEDIRETSVMTPAEPTVYLPTIFLPESDFAMWVSNMIAVVRVDGDPRAMLPRLREAVASAYPEIPLNSLATLDQVTARSFQQVSFAMTILVIAALMSLALGMVGIYGTVSYIVGQRTGEFGLRLALGASRRDVLRGVLAGGAALGLTGIGIGIAGALLASRAVRSMLFGVSLADPLVYAGVAGTLQLLVLFASLGPAARAAATDPADAMRSR